MGHSIEALNGLKPVMLMVAAQTLYAGANILLKLAINDGMSIWVLIAYRSIFATSFIVSLALLLERKSRPKLTWTVLFYAFLCGFFGLFLNQTLYIESLALTSATFIAAIFNVFPAITLILSVLFRMEKLELSTTIGRLKVLGILIGIGGAMVLSFYKGVEINIWEANVNLLKHNSIHHQNSHGGSWFLGCFLAFMACVSLALWLIIQAKMSKIYPCHYSSTALMSVMGLIQCLTLSLCVDRNWRQWKLGWNIRLLTTAYMGIVSSGLVVVIMIWCAHVRGPVFVSSFTPVTLVLVAIICSAVLDEKLHLGRYLLSFLNFSIII